MNIAICFPGQGSQQPGMATAWADVPAASRWSEADEILGWDVSRLGTDAPADELTEPLNCQVALFVHHVVLFETWRAAHPEIDIAMTAGHSLGEYNALHAAGAMSFEDGLGLVEVRANATQAAADDMPGTMIAALGFEVEEVSAACAQAGAHVANDNAVGQITVSGTPDQLAAVKDLLAEGRGKVRDIPVGAAYHSPHMAAAVAPLGEALDATAFADTTVPVIANVDASPHSEGAVWPDLLRRQVTSPVRWRESVLAMKEAGVEEIVELGATAVIGPMVKRIDRSIARTSITAPDQV
ncbi:ACP S-malonyltransferase [Euzebya tangerina]|uniref:ACP S-malonyltransferase n=1 Tax=Euzebya tangerina TaxID=591198 RepID=UPI0013C2FA5B|nr:ACP S-malonyltransferase [Euzebya tangerina]